MLVKFVHVHYSVIERERRRRKREKVRKKERREIEKKLSQNLLLSLC